jgi:hypothetical protein
MFIDIKNLITNNSQISLSKSFIDLCILQMLNVTNCRYITTSKIVHYLTGLCVNWALYGRSGPV